MRVRILVERFVGFLLLLVGLSCSSRGRPPSGLADWEIGPEQWLTSCAEATRDALQFAGKRGWSDLAEMPEGDLILLHHGFGTGVRNRENNKRVVRCSKPAT